MGRVILNALHLQYKHPERERILKVLYGESVSVFDQVIQLWHKPVGNLLETIRTIENNGDDKVIAVVLPRFILGEFGTLLRTRRPDIDLLRENLSRGPDGCVRIIGQDHTFDVVEADDAHPYDRFISTKFQAETIEPRGLSSYYNSRFVMIIDRRARLGRDEAITNSFGTPMGCTTHADLFQEHQDPYHDLRQHVLRFGGCDAIVMHRRIVWYPDTHNKNFSMPLLVEDLEISEGGGESKSRVRGLQRIIHAELVMEPVMPNA